MNKKGWINTFTKGMDKDTADQKFGNLSYRHAENFRLTTEDGGSTGALTNVEGNEKMFTLPPIYRITKLPNGYLNDDNNIPFLLTDADGNTSSINVAGSVKMYASAQNDPFDPNGTLTVEDFGVTPLVDALNNNTGYQGKLKAYELAGFLSGTGTSSGTEYIYNDPSEALVWAPDYVDITLQNPISGCTTTKISEYKVIGSTNLRDDIILFTTEDNSEVGGEGQIWRISYSVSTLETEIDLVYAGPINLSTQYLIEAVGRYETIDLQRIYWTDNFNSIRSLNTVDPDRFKIAPDLLDLRPQVTLIPAVINEIGDRNTGGLDKGTYQVSYRLQTRNGVSTNLAPWSTPININGASEEVEHWNYKRSDHTDPDSNCNKSLSFTVDEIDGGFDYIEVFLLKRGISQGLVFKVDTLQLVNTTENIDFVVTGLEGDFEEIFRDEIESFNASFTTAKTLTIKDNRLLVGNIKEDNQIIDYDARAFRYQSSSSTTYNNADDINPYNRDEEQDFRFQEGTTVLGGTGDNVSYRFQTRNMVLDTEIEQSPRDFPLIKLDKNAQSATLNGRSYNLGGLWQNYRNPYWESLFKGYTRDEIYRFGILFYDKYSKPLDVKWIGDIRMPSNYDSGFNLYDLVNLSNNKAELRAKILNLEFTVNIAGIKDLISGYSIVRAPRPNKDKTILGQGMVGDTAYLRYNPYFMHNYYYTQGDDRSEEAIEEVNNYQEYRRLLGGIQDVGFQHSLFRNLRGHEDDATIAAAANFVASRDNSGNYDWDTWLDEGRDLLCPLLRVARPLEGATRPILEDSPLPLRVITFDSPDLQNNFGRSDLYGGIIGGPEEGIRDQFRPGLSIKPIMFNKGWRSSNTTVYDIQVGTQTTPPTSQGSPNRIQYNTYTSPIVAKIAADERRWKYYDPAYTANYNILGDNTLSGFNVSESLPKVNINTYKGYSFGEFPKTADKRIIGVDNGMVPNTYVDNFISNNTSSTTALNVGTSNNVIYHNIGACTRNNTNPSPVLKLTDQYREWYGPKGISNSINYIDSGLLKVDQQQEFARQANEAVFIIANLYRNNIGQYGGETQLDIAATEYIHIGHYQKVTSASPNVIVSSVYGGDTYIGINNITKSYPSERLDTPPNDVYQFATRVSAVSLQAQSEWSAKADEVAAITARRDYTGISVPMESTVNTEMAFEKDFTSYLSRSELTQRDTVGSYNILNMGDQNNKDITDGLNWWPFSVDEEFLAYQRFDNTYNLRIENDFANFQKEDYSEFAIAFDPNAVLSTEFDNRIYASDTKINGETQDSWLTFRVANTLDVDGHHGPLNKLETINENVMFFQDTGFGVLSINPRNIIAGPDGSELLLGSGDVLNDSNYISTEIGSRHQHSIVKSKSSIYFFDANSRKFYRYNGRTEPLSDLKGLSAYFYNNFKGDILREDNLYTGAGITAAFDPRFNEVLFTFKDIDSNDTVTKETVVFSEAMGNFSSFYSATPDIYIQDDNKYFSPDPNNPKEVYVHNEGQKVTFYGTTYPSKIDTTINPKGYNTKIFNNIEYLSQVRDTNGNDIVQDTFDEIIVYNEYQSVTKGLLPFGETLSSSDIHVRRRMRNWRLQIPRSGAEKARIRNPYTNIGFTYNNQDDKTFLLNDIITYYTDVNL